MSYPKNYVDFTKISFSNLTETVENTLVSSGV